VVQVAVVLMMLYIDAVDHSFLFNLKRKKKFISFYLLFLFMPKKNFKL
jgi:hypothetical protein